MISVRFVPCQNWPGEKTSRSDRREATFRASYAKTLDLLDTELFQLGAFNVTIQAYFQHSDIRNDGWPYSNAKPAEPGVMLGFVAPKKHGGGHAEYSFPCDTFTEWEDNLRGIALSLEALRKIDRYGVTQGNQQYKGWAKLPAPESSSNGAMNKREAAMFILKVAWPLFQDDDVYGGQINRAYREAAAKLHPDKQGGSHELFIKLQKAKEVLEGRNV